MSQPADITGQRFGRLVALRVGDPAPCGVRRWFCKCDCGGATLASVTHLRRGTVKSCGCLRVDVSIALNTTHGRSKTRLYWVWSDMLRRCNNKRHHSYENYGGRGVKVCERWSDFSSFLADMGEPPAGMSIDRYPNNDGDYEPGNCRWATRSQQNRNRRNNRLLTYDGQTKTLAEWAAVSGLKREVLRDRLNRGRPIGEALAPVRK